jgi:hypothetical protein
MPRPRPVIDRVREKIDSSGGPDACHQWLGNFGQWGSPMISVGKGGRSPRRIVWNTEHGEELTKDQHVYMTCGRKDCMNSRHFTLFPLNDEVTRFWRYVKRAQGDGCWLWMAHRQSEANKRRRGAGYGNFMIKSCTKRVAAHRYSYELHFGPIPPGMCVCHRCDNPPCVRPDHLFLGTRKDNTQDMIRKGRAHSMRKLSAEDDARLGELRAVGATYAQLSKEFGVSNNAIWESLKRLGVIQRPGAGQPNGTREGDQ